MFCLKSVCYVLPLLFPLSWSLKPGPRAGGNPGPRMNLHIMFRRGRHNSEGGCAICTAGGRSYLLVLYIEINWWRLDVVLSINSMHSTTLQLGTCGVVVHSGFPTTVKKEETDSQKCQEHQIYTFWSRNAALAVLNFSVEKHPAPTCHSSPETQPGRWLICRSATLHIICLAPERRWLCSGKGKRGCGMWAETCLLWRGELGQNWAGGSIEWIHTWAKRAMKEVWSWMLTSPWLKCFDLGSYPSSGRKTSTYL